MRAEIGSFLFERFSDFPEKLPRGSCAQAVALFRKGLRKVVCSSTGEGALSSSPKEPWPNMTKPVEDLAKKGGYGTET
jgi:hypothetical protein